MVGKISHELRTPLNNIRIILHIACSYSGLTKEFIEEYLKPALQSSDYLLSLTNDILDYTEMNIRNKIRLVFEPVDIPELILSIKGIFSINCTIRKIDLIFTILGDAPDQFYTDKRRLK